jgi:hypothetical protein
MKLTIMFAAGLVGWALAAGSANADTIFDVEHARADARAGLVSENDVEFLRRWGGPSGYYPAPRYYDDVRPYRRGYSTRYDRRGRRW